MGGQSQLALARFGVGRMVTRRTTVSAMTGLAGFAHHDQFLANLGDGLESLRILRDFLQLQQELKPQSLGLLLRDGFYVFDQAGMNAGARDERRLTPARCWPPTTTWKVVPWRPPAG